MANTDWTDAQNDLLVADYFAMLAEDAAGRSYNKAAHNRALQAALDRTKGSIEFKHQNVSAVLKALGEQWLAGYKPAFNFQMSLVDAVARRLEQDLVWLERQPAVRPSLGLDEARELWIGPAPTYSNAPPPPELELTQRVARKFDVAARDARNRSLGRAGEQRVLAHERAALLGHGRDDLARRLRWVSEEDGDGAGYDILSFTPEGRERLIEVKTTNGWERTPFYITANELAVADAHRREWSLMRLYDFNGAAKAFELYPPLEAHVSLTASVFSAGFH